ncbi:MAG: hypothetical protein HYS58_00765 [Elusimicrobia bacterium]|nr:hypothetical protein [Elusimicrobiota bacterium]
MDLSTMRLIKMNKALKLLVNIVLGSIFLILSGCSGRQIGLSEVKLVNLAEPFSALEPALYSADDAGELVKELIRSYQKYGALFVAVERESPTIENTCYELEEKVRQVKPLLRQQTDFLVRIQGLYSKLEKLRKDDRVFENAIGAGKAFIAKAEQRIQKHDELMDITNSFSDDCPGAFSILFGTGGLLGLASAKAKVPTFNETASNLEKLSDEEKSLAVQVVQSLKALR